MAGSVLGLTTEINQLEEELDELRAKDTPDLGARKRIPKLFGDIERLKRTLRVPLRGGSWDLNLKDLHSAFRNGSGILERSNNIGFRLSMWL